MSCGVDGIVMLGFGRDARRWARVPVYASFNLLLCMSVYADGCMYQTMHEFYKDVMLVWDNAIRYNARDNVVHQRAVEYKKRFYDEFTRVLQE